MTDAAFMFWWRNLQRRGRLFRMRRAKEYQKTLLKELRLVRFMTMRRRMNKDYSMLAKPLFKKALNSKA